MAQKVEIRCPVCSNKNFIEISEEAAKGGERGLIAVNIIPGMICEHQFIAYLDKNLKVRDCLTADFHIDFTDEAPEELQRETVKIDIIDMDIIKINLTPQIITYAIRGIVLKQPLVLISDTDFLFNHFLNFFKYITQDSFELDMTFLTLEYYMNQKAEFEDAIVLGRNEVLRDEKDLIDPKKLKIEKAIVDDFFKELDLKVSIIFLKNELQKLFQISKSLCEIIKEFQELRLNNPKEMRSRLENLHNTKIPQNFFDLLLAIAKYSFNTSFD